MDILIPVLFRKEHVLFVQNNVLSVRELVSCIDKPQMEQICICEIGTGLGFELTADVNVYGQVF